jgi:hypothetical protein
VIWRRASSEIYLTRGDKLRSPIEAAGCAVARGLKSATHVLLQLLLGPSEA